MLKTVSLIYILGFVLIVSISLISSLVENISQNAHTRFNPFILLFIVVVLFISYYTPQLLRLLFRGKQYTGKHAQSLLDFAQSKRTILKALFVIPAKSSNAYSCGLGGNKTVVFHSKTLELHPIDELEGVMAHELGHYANKDQLFLSGLVMVILLGTTFVSGALRYSRFGSTLLLESFVETTLLFPVVLIILQWRERLADAYAKRILDDPEKFVRFFERVVRAEEKRTGKKIQSHPNPILKFLRTHPTINDRIEFLRS